VADAPQTKYAKSGNVHVAYQAIGEGPVDVVLVPNWITHVEAMWEIPSIARYLRRLSSFARVLVYDQQGTGMSDPMLLDAPPTLEARMDEVLAVMNAAGSDRAAVVGFESGSPMAMVFAATHPDRTQALVIINGYARIIEAPDYPNGLPESFMRSWFEGVVDTWGTPTRVAGEAGPEDELWAWYQRQAASPGTVAALISVLQDTDVRHVLPTIRTPTLILAHEHPTIVQVTGRQMWTESCQYIADNIEGSEFRVVHPELETEADLSFFIDDIREFLTGAREAPEESDRVLATVMFSDIVGSTELAAKVGDREYKELLDAHDAMIRRQLDRFRGREVKALGDGFLATFDGPARAIGCASAVRDAAHRLGIEVRIGLHTGEIELRGDDVGGIAVHIAARVASLAGADEIIVSRTVTDLVAGSGLRFADRGPSALKGVPGEWQLFAVES
jgi:class 3 adenylate cyclase